MIAFFLISFILLSCGDSDETINTENKKYPDEDIEEFIWETNGGGDILFSITRVDDQFKLSIERYNFQSVDVVIMLTDKDLEVFGLVKNIFNEIINMYDYTFTPEGCTGTWTQIILKFTGNQELEIENIKATDAELRILYDFAKENTEQLH